MARTVRSPLGRLGPLRGGRLALAIAVALGLVLIVLRMAASFQVDLLWFDSVGYRPLFLRRLAWAWGTRLVVGVAVALALFLNLRLVARTLGTIQIKRRFGDLVIAEQLPRAYVLAAAAALAAMVGLWFGGSVPEGVGIQALMAATAGAWGVRDPVFALDLGFYVFQLPLLRTVVTFTMVVVFLVFTVCLGGYAATGALRWGRGSLVMGEVPRIHLGGLIGAFLALVAARLWLGRYLLLLYGTSEVQGIFGYTDAEARLPALQLMTVVTLGSAVLVAWGAWKNRAVPVLAGLVLVAAGGILGVQFYPSLIQRFRVEPNELSREAPYIDMNLRFTRLGFALDDLERRRFGYAPPDGVDWETAAGQLDGLPVWSNEALLTAYQALEARFRYYDFARVAIDRYPAAEGPAVVALSVREVEPAGIEDQNWQNLHLRERYMAGMGAVASDAVDRTAEGRPSFFLSQIPPVFQPGPGAPAGIVPERTSVFFGLRAQPYAVVNPGDSSFLAPGGAPGRPGVDYPEGIALSSPLRTLAFAWDLGEPNLLFSSEVDADSRIVIRRRVAERVQEIFPYLRYPEDPYPVVHDGRLVWVLDGFTGTRSFPLSVPRQVDFGRQYAYVRNSVRVVVDAVGGAVTFYRLPGADPLLDGYDRAFPGVFRPFDDLPPGLRSHLRYSRTLLELQAEVLLQYHQETPEQFHGQQDVWATPSELGEGETAVVYRPEYGLWRLPEEEEETFLLTTTFVPAGRQNLTALLTGRIGEDGVQDLFLYDIAVEDQAPGPRQVEALVEQDPAIRQQFALWRTGGSRVWTGHLHVVPSGPHLLYMEAVYLAAQDSPIPELRRYVLSDGRNVVMTPTLGEALAAFRGEEVALPAFEGGLPSTEGEPWPAEALQLLERAEARLRGGDWTGFGTALRELRDLLERLSPVAAPEGG